MLYHSDSHLLPRTEFSCETGLFIVLLVKNETLCNFLLSRPEIRVRWGNLGLRGNLGLFAFRFKTGRKLKFLIRDSIGVKIYAFRTSLSGVEELFDNF